MAAVIDVKDTSGTGGKAPDNIALALDIVRKFSDAFNIPQAKKFCDNYKSWRNTHEAADGLQMLSDYASDYKNFKNPETGSTDSDLVQEIGYILRSAFKVLTFPDEESINDEKIKETFTKADGFLQEFMKLKQSQQAAKEQDHDKIMQERARTEPLLYQFKNRNNRWPTAEEYDRLKQEKEQRNEATRRRENEYRAKERENEALSRISANTLDEWITKVAAMLGEGSQWFAVKTDFSQDLRSRGFDNEEDIEIIAEHVMNEAEKRAPARSRASPEAREAEILEELGKARTEEHGTGQPVQDEKSNKAAEPPAAPVKKQTWKEWGKEKKQQWQKNRAEKLEQRDLEQFVQRLVSDVASRAGNTSKLRDSDDYYRNFLRKNLEGIGIEDIEKVVNDVMRAAQIKLRKMEQAAEKASERHERKKVRQTRKEERRKLREELKQSQKLKQKPEQENTLSEEEPPHGRFGSGTEAEGEGMEFTRTPPAPAGEAPAAVLQLMVESYPAQGIPIAINGTQMGETGRTPAYADVQKNRIYEISVPRVFQSVQGGLEFEKWSDGVTSPSRRIAIKDSMVIGAHYKKIEEKTKVRRFAPAWGLPGVSGPVSTEVQTRSFKKSAALRGLENKALRILETKARIKNRQILKGLKSPEKQFKMEIKAAVKEYKQVQKAAKKIGREIGKNPADHANKFRLVEYKQATEELQQKQHDLNATFARDKAIWESGIVERKREFLEYLKAQAADIAVIIGGKYKLESSDQQALAAKLDSHAMLLADRYFTNTAFTRFFKTTVSNVGRTMATAGTFAGQFGENFFENIWNFIFGPWTISTILVFVSFWLTLTFYGYVPQVLFIMPLIAAGFTWVLNFSENFRPFDWVTHFMSGALIGYSAIWLLLILKADKWSFIGGVGSFGFWIAWFILAFIGVFQFYQGGEAAT
ncbi:MAG: hypothetical protein HY514_03895 [Candidatus Aenigmarchaeota archaeon]|nr:hypothetical protein [Candidatus Aenigmarchaeota archaeon]